MLYQFFPLQAGPIRDRCLSDERHFEAVELSLVVQNMTKFASDIFQLFFRDLLLKKEPKVEEFVGFRLCDCLITILALWRRSRLAIDRSRCQVYVLDAWLKSPAIQLWMLLCAREVWSFLHQGHELVDAESGSGRKLIESPGDSRSERRLACSLSPLICCTCSKILKASGVVSVGRFAEKASVAAVEDDEDVGFGPDKDTLDLCPVDTVVVLFIFG